MIEIKNYRVLVFGPTSERRANIRCLGGGEEPSVFGDIHFYTENPPRDRIMGAGWGGQFIQMHLTVDMLDPVLDLFRNEAPLYLSFNEDKSLATLSTGPELTGEEES